MKKVIETDGVPIKLWLDDIEPGALDQATNLARLPFVFKHIAIMPDSHQGYGMPIGGVMATNGVVVPNAVGVDIGCGMCAVKTSLQDIGTQAIKDVMGEIRKAVPVGMNHHKEKQDVAWIPVKDKFLDGIGYYKIVNEEINSAHYQVGTLGGGNHFIEIQRGSDGFIYIMIHSGSRNLGFKVANHYGKVAKNLNAKWFSSVSADVDLAFLPIDSLEGQAYLAEMAYCVEFAFFNRSLMLQKIASAFRAVVDVEFYDIINIAHNYAVMEHHFGENVMVHRKGATRARDGEIGIIPGSQGTSSYIVRGLGNKDSFESCSHGAGRKMGRKQAQRELGLEFEKKRLDDLGVIHGLRNQKDLDEAAGAYKDISVVMANQSDLVEVVVELKPLAVIKG